MKSLGRKGEPWDDLVNRVLGMVYPEEGSVSLPVREEVYQFLLALSEAMGDSRAMVPIDVSEAATRVISKFCLALGYRGDSFLDMGFSKVRAAKIATFLGIEDEFNALSVIATGSLNALIELYEVEELEPILDEVVKILVKRKARGMQGSSFKEV